MENNKLKDILTKFYSMNIISKIIFLLVVAIATLLIDLLLPLVVVSILLLISIYILKGLIYNPIKFILKKITKLWKKK